MLKLLERPHSENQAVEVTGVTDFLPALTLQLIHPVNGQVPPSLQALVFSWVNLLGWDTMIFKTVSLDSKIVQLTWELVKQNVQWYP